MKKAAALGLVVLAFVFISQACRGTVKGDLVSDVRKVFADPPAEYRSAPLWVWNDRVTKEEIDSQLADFKAHGIGGVFIHPRPGLITPYLSDEWFDLCRHAVEVGKSLGMKVWIYDENSYPSGFAGGHVPAEMPDSAGLGLRLTKASVLPASFAEKPVAVLRAAPAGFENVTEKALEPQAASALGQGDYYIFEVQKAAPGPWFAGFTYVDLMRRDVTEKFLDITLNAYKRAIGGEFGATVPGTFQDEANIASVTGKNIVGFTPQIFEAYQRKWGADLRTQLPSLFEEKGDWRAVRHHFYATTLDLFIRGWAEPYYDYCAANKLLLTGHYFEHEWPHPHYTSDFLAMFAHAHIPGIDCLMNQWDQGTHGQFGNARPPKEIRSAANQLGRTRTLSETYGAGGWDLRFFDQKRIADWELALGVNFVDQHLSYMTIMGARKRDHPQSFSYHEPWWPAYKVMGDYLGRLSTAMTLGRQLNKALVLEPTTTAWMYYSPESDSDHFKAIGESFTAFINRLNAEQVDYDLASEDTLREHGGTADRRLVVGERSYDVIVLSPGTENLEPSTVDLLGRHLAAGGRVLAAVETPGFVGGQASEAVAQLAAAHAKGWVSMKEDAAVQELVSLSSADVRFSDLTGDKTMFFHHRRVLADGELVFLANTHPDKSFSGTFSARGRSVEIWDPFTGQASSYPGVVRKGMVSVDFGLAPGGSALFCLRRTAGQPVPEKKFDWSEVTADGEVEVQPVAPNVLTIDYCDLNLGGRLEKDLYFYDAQRKTFQFHGLKADPWDNAVQYNTSVLDLNKFTPDSGFEATFWFEAAAGIDVDSLRLVVERPALYQVSINGARLEPLADEWWLDKAFGVFELGRGAVPGRNRITLKARPFTIFTELESVYVLGNFGLESAAKGFRLVPQKPMRLGAWSDQGRPLYGGGVSYVKTFDTSRAGGRDRYIVKLTDWLGSVAEVKVGEKSAGYLAFAPFEMDITDLLTGGKNVVSVTVYGTLKNTLGPHHNHPSLGLAWPGMFQKGAEGGYPPGSEYSVVGYGLFDDFKLLKKTQR